MAKVDAAVDWFTDNFAILATLVGSVIGVVTYVNGIDVRLGRMEDKVQGRILYADARFAELRTQMDLVVNLPYRMQQVEMAQSAANARMDKISETLLSAVEGIKRDVSTLSTQLAVTSAKIDSLDVPRVQSRASTLPSPAGYTPSLRPQTASSTGPLSPLQ